MEYEQIQAFFFVLLTICGGVITIAGVVALVVKFWKWAHKDTDSNTDKLAEHDTYLASDKRRIEELEKQQDKLEEMMKLELRVLRALLRHEIDGNHVEQLEAMSTQIDEFLIEKK